MGVGLADQAITRAATTLPTTEVLALAGELRAIDRDTAGYELCVGAAMVRPAVGILEIVAALREEGRPVDAKNLLATVANQAPWSTVSDLLSMCTDIERQKLLDMIANRPIREISEVLATIVAGGRSPLSKDELLARMAATADGTAVAAALRELPNEDADLLFSMVIQAGNDRVEPVWTH